MTKLWTPLIKGIVESDFTLTVCFDTSLAEAEMLWQLHSEEWELLSFGSQQDAPSFPAIDW